jgi:hypothetical protein
LTLKVVKKYKYIIIIKIIGNIDKNKFCIKSVEINFDEDSKKIIDKKPKEYILNFCVLNVRSLLDFNINKSEIVIRNVIYIGFINLEYISL